MTMASDVALEKGSSTTNNDMQPGAPNVLALRPVPAANQNLSGKQEHCASGPSLLYCRLPQKHELTRLPLFC